MKLSKLIGSTVLALTAFSTMACSAARDVEVQGEVTAAQSVAVSGEILLVFLEKEGEGEEETLTQIHDVKLSKLGAFTETVPIEGDEVIIRAIDDADGDGACTAGEAWAETVATIAEDKVESAKLQLANGKCPAAVAD